jgi:putative transcriptional regulator
MQNRIKEMRDRLLLTQEDLAERVHVTRQTIISLEKGKYNPSILLAAKVARVFKTEIESVFIFDKEDLL